MHILVVDDDPVGLLVARTVVEQLGHRVSVASDGEQAWRMVQDGAYDVVLTDREMPGLDGLELCRRVRGLDGQPGRRYGYVVLLTGHDAYDEALVGLQAGADDYLIKPLDPDRLRLRLVVAERVTCLHAQLAHQRRDLAALHDAQHALARQDALTGLPNRRALQEELDGGPGWGALALFDLDHFRAYNVAAGHGAGDDALRRVAAVLGDGLGERGRLYRYGGEEFVALLAAGTDGTAALDQVERLRVLVRGLGLVHPGRPGQVLTVSAGVSCRGDGAPGGVELLGGADRALFLAKRDGRDGARLAGAEAALAAAGDGTVRVVLDPAPLRALHELGRRIGRDVAEEVVRTYLRQSDQRVAALRSALDGEAADELARGAHELRSSSATIGATAVSQACAELEQAHLWPRRRRLVDDLQVLTGETNAALQGQLRLLLSA